MDAGLTMGPTEVKAKVMDGAYCTDVSIREDRVRCGWLS